MSETSAREFKSPNAKDKPLRSDSYFRNLAWLIHRGFELMLGASSHAPSEVSAQEVLQVKRRAKKPVTTRCWEKIIITGMRNHRQPTRG
jgi:hypothetical protein